MSQQYYAVQDETKKTSVIHGHWAYPLLGEAHGCKNECAAGVSYYAAAEYTPPAVHPYQEGFFVLRGVGVALVNGMEIALKPELSFFVPTQTLHSLKSDGAEPLVLFWFHAGL